jgi:predicted acyl esterase
MVFRTLAPGSGYRVRLTGTEAAESRALTVMSVESSQPSAAWYGEQTLKAGFNYLTMRDGTTLSAWVTIPPGRGPFPTVVTYSGYDESRPQQPSSQLKVLCGDFPVVCTPPTDGSALVAGMLGYATVGVNMRGTGCSGGAYDYFETLQVLDGYDVVEIVVAQSWVLGHRVGMVGLSYPGISQLFVAAARPPSLAAIAPMSVLGSTTTTLWPGGILNDGFALTWADSVLSRAAPYGQGWEGARVNAGDQTCGENQLLHGQLVDSVAQAKEFRFYDAARDAYRDPTTFVDRIEVPVFLAGQWQDDQSGPYFNLLLDKFTHAPARRFIVTNGVHPDGLAPEQLMEWQTFLELYVARRKPVDPVKLRNIAPLFYGLTYDAPLSLPAPRFADAASFEEALAAWEAELPVQVLFESGAGDTSQVGAPVAVFERRFDRWPPKETKPLTLWFQPGGGLAEAPPTVSGSASSFTLDPTAGAKGVLAPGAQVWTKLPQYAWEAPAPGSAVVMESGPLASDLVLAGTASVDLWLNAPVDDADLQVTLSEVRPDGQEVYVQSGWLRASYRKPGPGATAWWPAQTLEEGAWAPLVPGEWTEVRVGTAGFAHVVRAGSKVRLSVDTPGGVRASWRFALKTFPGVVTFGIGHDAAHASKVVLPWSEGVSAPPGLPLCPSLRGQPCRVRPDFTNASWP